jgi:glycine/D-amino acid oxidase-like deaminating enzyme
LSQYIECFFVAGFSVISAGIISLATALELAKRAGEVTVLEHAVAQVE